MQLLDTTRLISPQRPSFALSSTCQELHYIPEPYRLFPRCDHPIYFRTSKCGPEHGKHGKPLVWKPQLSTTRNVAANVARQTLFLVPEKQEADAPKDKTRMRQPSLLESEKPEVDRQKVWTRMMKKIQTCGSPVTVLRDQRKAGKLSKETVIGTLVRFKRMHEWKYIIEIIEWLKNQEWWTLTELDQYLLLTAYGKEGEPEKVEGAIRSMHQSGITPTVVSYTSLIEAYGRKGLLSRSESIFQNMLSNGPTPSAVTYQTMIKLLIEGGRLEDAEKIFSSMAKEDGATTKPDQRLFNLMIHAYGKSGKVEESLKLFCQMKVLGIPFSVVTFNTLLAYQSNVKDAKRVFHQMKAENIQPDVFTYTSLINAYSKAGRAEEAHLLFREMVTSGIRTNRTAYNALLDAFANAGSVGGAEMVFKQMSDDRCSPDLRLYTTLMHAYAKTRQLEQAEQLLVKMKAAGLEPNVVAFSILMKGYADKKDLDGMLKKYEELKRSGVQPNQTVFTIIIQAYGRQADFSNALSWFKEMIASGLDPDERARRTLMEFSKTSEDKQQALELMDVGRDVLSFCADLSPQI